MGASWDEVLEGSESRSLGGSDRFTPIADEAGRMLVILANLLEITSSSMTGSVFQHHLDQCLQNGIVTEGDLWLWLREQAEPRRIRRASFDAARRKAAGFGVGGLWLASVEADDSSSGEAASCPRTLFGRGRKTLENKAVAWFNSGKPRIVQPEALWLRGLRLTLGEMRTLSTTFVASTGTLSYELVSAFAASTSSPLLQILPDSLISSLDSEKYAHGTPRHSSVTALSCHFGRNRCPKAVRWTCRDRLVAHLADVHIVLDLRPSSRLAQILSDQHCRDPRAIWVLKGTHEDDSLHSGNQELIERLPVQPRFFHVGGSPSEVPRRTSPARLSGAAVCDEWTPCWKDYLYHYTRGCNGPWPGEDLHRYCIGILEGAPLSSHSALATLARILNERRIRASHLLVRRVQSVVSLTSRPPHELHLFRRWNRSKARWTLDPYGIALRKTILKSKGARPTIYGGESVYRRLRPEDRYRFQSRGRRTSWTGEREWRLGGDLRLEELDPGDYFVFVPNGDVAGRLADLAEIPGRCVTLDRV